MILKIEQGRNNLTLRARSGRVEIFNGELNQLVKNMQETLAATENGIGLAAPQVGQNVRLFVISPEFREQTGGRLIYINPVIVSRSWFRKEKIAEGCLSLPDEWAELPRALKITVKAQDEHGRSFKVRGRELLARLFEHEVDHLNGVLFVDHLK